MRALALAAVFLVPIVLSGQSPRTGGWRFGLEAGAPTRLLALNERTFPDSNDGHTDLGIGFAVSAERYWRLRDDRGRWALIARATSAPVKGSLGGATFDAGRALVLDLGVRLAREVRERSEVLGGVGISHWSGPEETAPFTGLGSALFFAETGYSYQFTNQPWRVSANVNMTRFGGDETRAVKTGVVWRAMLGVSRDY